MQVSALRNGDGWTVLSEQSHVWDGAAMHVTWTANRNATGWRMFVDDGVNGFQLVNMGDLSPPATPGGQVYAFVWDGAITTTQMAVVGDTYTVRVETMDATAGSIGDAQGLPAWVKWAAGAVLLVAVARR